MLDFNDAPRLQVIDPQDFDRRLNDLRAALLSRTEEFVRDIFPLARIQRGEARIGNIQGEPGESLSIGLVGERAGLWFDHATSEGGDIIDLWTKAYGQADFLKAIEELEQWAGLSRKPRWTSAVTRIAEDRKRLAASAPKPAFEALPPPSASYHYISADGSVLGIMRRYEDWGILDDRGKPKKTFRATNARGEPKMPDPRPLFRIPEIKNASTVVLVEGEKCALALERVGVEATTAMGGSGADPAKTDWSPLAGKTVLVWEDNDKAGAGLTERVRPALEPLGCVVVAVPIPSGKPNKWDAADAVDEGEDIRALLDAAVVPAQAPARARIPIYSRRQLRELKRPAWMVDDVIVEGSVISIYGPSGSLKSFVAIDIAMSVATGQEWQGRAVRAGPVIYVTGEGRDQIGFRLDAWERAHSYTDDAPIFIIPLGIAISDPEWVGHLIEAIEGSGSSPVMIWLDTLARTFGAGDENSQKDMNAFISGVDRLRDHFRCVVGIVHHTGKDSDRGLRGSSALYAAMDTVIRTDRKAGQLLVTLKNQQPHGKQKDAAEFEDITLEAKVVKLGEDEKGRPLTSLALSLADAEGEPESSEAPAKTAAGRPQGANQHAVMSALKKANGEPLGLTRLGAMARLDNNRLAEATAKLVAKGLVHEIGEAGGRKWVLA